MKSIARFVVAVAAVTLSASAVAQTAWPTAKPISIIVPFSAGGSVDATARLVAQKLSERLKQSVVVERLNRELDEVLRADDVCARMAEQGASGGSGSPAEFARFVQREQERYARIVQSRNIKE